jgi:hypothetical protein
MKRLTNRKRVRLCALDTANERQARMNRPPKFRRVSKSFLNEVDAETRRIVSDRAAHYSQRGVTLR